jgi:CheY-like chemotaxis protein
MALILVADDEENVRAVIRRVLSRAGHEVAEAADGEQALALLGQRHFDLAVLDIVMPRKGGIETLMQIYADSRNLKILIISGKVDTGSDAFRNLTARFGASRILKKPFGAEELLAEVDALLATAP